VSVGSPGDLLVRGARVVQGRAGRRRLDQADLLVSAGRIAAVLPAGSGPPGVREIDADGLLALPGLVDAHVHFDEPGREHWEGWATGSAAAAAGGVTTVVDMPIDSAPPTVTVAALAAKRECATRKSIVDFALWAGLTPESLHHVDDLLAAGAVGLKAFGCESGWEDFPPVDSRTLGGGLRAADRVGAVVALHAELPHAQRAGTTDVRSADRAEDAEAPAVAWAARCAVRVRAATATERVLPAL
jgi:allantoinase